MLWGLLTTTTPQTNQTHLCTEDADGTCTSADVLPVLESVNGDEASKIC